MHLQNMGSKLLQGLMVASMAIMSLLVFINVVLRYGFNSNIGVSEELSRLLFVWLTFFGAISAFAKNAHVGVDTFVRRMPLRLQRLVSILSNVAMLFVCGMILVGCWRLAVLSTDNYLPVSGIPVSTLYFAGVPAAIFIGGILVMRLWQAIANSNNGKVK